VVKVLTKINTGGGLDGGKVRLQLLVVVSNVLALVEGQGSRASQGLAQVVTHIVNVAAEVSV